MPLPGVGREQPADHADGRGLAGAVRAEEADDLAAVDREVDMVDHGPAAEALGQALDVDDRARRS